MVARAIVAFFIFNTVISGAFGWAAYYVGIQIGYVSYRGWDGFWIVGGGSFAGITAVVLLAGLIVGLIEWVIGE